MRVFCISNQLFNIGQHRKEGCFRGLIEVLPNCFCCEWRKPRPISHEGWCPGPDSNWNFQNVHLEGYNKGLRNF
jgi:hypothetical protein